MIPMLHHDGRRQQSIHPQHLLPPPPPTTINFVSHTFICIPFENSCYLAIRFKESPFFSVEQAVSGVTECPGLFESHICVVFITEIIRLLESTSATDRRVATFTFSLTHDQLTKMKTPGCVILVPRGSPFLSIFFK
jgi:E3 SUMO-protein ligase PIAS1